GRARAALHADAAGTDVELLRGRRPGSRLDGRAIVRAGGSACAGDADRIRGDVLQRAPGLLDPRAVAGPVAAAAAAAQTDRPGRGDRLRGRRAGLADQCQVADAVAACQRNTVHPYGDVLRPSALNRRGSVAAG